MRKKILMIGSWAALVTIPALAIGIAIGKWVSIDNHRSIEKKAHFLIDEFTSRIINQFTLYEYGVRGARGAIVAAGGLAMTRAEFESYHSSREIDREFPGAAGFGFIVRVPSDRAAKFVDDARNDGAPDFEITGQPHAGERYIIKYIYPRLPNLRAEGLDIASEPNRRAAALSAARSGEPKMTAPITLVQKTGALGQGFLILLPIYAMRADISTEDAREAALIGWSYAPLAASDVLKAFDKVSNELAFSLTDVEEGTTFYRSASFHDSDLVLDPGRSKDVNFLGRRWRIHFQMTDAVSESLSINSPTLVAVEAGVSSAALFLGLITIVRARRARRSLEQVESDFAAAVINATQHALLLVDDDFHIVYANRAAGAQFKLSQNVLLQAPIDALLPTLQLDEVNRPTTRTGLEITALCADGDTFLAAIHTHSVKIAGRCLVLVSLRDVSAERAATAQLAQSEREWQELANSLPHLVWTSDATGACTFASAQWQRYVGAPMEVLLGSGLIRRVHPDDLERTKANWERALSMRMPFECEHRLLRHDAAYRWFSSRAVPTSTGSAVRWFGSCTDIDDRKLAELEVRRLIADMEEQIASRTLALATTRRHLQSTLDAVPSLIAYWDRDLMNRFVNRAYQEWFGVSADWLSGRHMNELHGPEIFEQFRTRIDAVLVGEPQSFEGTLPNQNGRSINVHIDYAPNIREGEVHGFYALVTDVSKLKASEMIARDAQDKAETANQAKSMFLTSMSHELRTPLNAIIGFSDLLLSINNGRLSEKDREYLGYIQSSGNYLLHLINDILQLSVTESGKATVSIEPIDVITIVSAFIANISKLVQDKKIDIINNVKLSNATYVMGDQTRLLQILINLGTNAVKYNKDSGWVKIDCHSISEQMLRISISDGGRGIPLARQSEIFEPFNRLGEEHGKIEGTGVGLAIVKGLARMMGGELGFESVENIGSTFWIDMPLANSALATKVELECHEAPQIALEPGLSRRVLYIEDNELNRVLLRSFLSSQRQIQLVEASSGEEGLEIARASTPDAIFLDLNLPGIDGFEVLKQLKAERVLASIPIIALTAHAMPGDAERALRAGFDDFLTKPVRMSSVFNALARALKQPKEPARLS